MLLQLRRTNYFCLRIRKATFFLAIWADAPVTRSNSSNKEVSSWIKALVEAPLSFLSTIKANSVTGSMTMLEYLGRVGTDTLKQMELTKAVLQQPCSTETRVSRKTIMFALTNKLVASTAIARLELTLTPVDLFICLKMSSPDPTGKLATSRSKRWIPETKINFSESISKV